MDRATIVLELTKAIIIAKPTILKSGKEVEGSIELLKKLWAASPEEALKDSPDNGDDKTGAAIKQRREERYSM